MIVVLGGGGFIGQHLRQSLLADGAAFTIVSPRPLSCAGPTSAQEDFMAAEEFQGPQGDVLLSRASVLVNLASRSVPGTHVTQPWREVEDRVALAARLFGRCSEINPALKIVQISSGGTVYGSTDQERVEETTPCAPISAYGLAHVMIEEYLRFSGRTRGIPYNILRVANPVGRFQKDINQGIVAIATRAAVSGSKFSLFGNGLNVRDYLDAYDVAEAILAACHDTSHTAAVWNVGSGIGRSVLNVIHLVEKVTCRSLAIEPLPARNIDVPKIVLNCDLIHADLGWRAHRDLESSIRDILRSLCSGRQS